MNFRTRKQTFQEKMDNIYNELNNINSKQNKINPEKNKIMPKSKKHEERIRLFDKTILNTPSKHNKNEKNLFYLIEETKRNSLGCKSFLKFNNFNSINNSFYKNNFNKTNRNLKKFHSANSSFDSESKLDKLSRNNTRRDTLKKEIMDELDKNKRKSSNISPSYFSNKKSIKGF